MINRLLTTLNGSAADTVALQASITQLAEDRAATIKALAELNERRRQAILDDAPDDEILVLEREVDRANIRLEKLAAAEQPLRERLAAAQAAAHRREIGKRWKVREAKYRKLVAALEVAATIYDDITGDQAAARAEIGEAAAVRYLPHIHFLGPLTRAHAAFWRGHVERAFAAGAPVIEAPAPRSQIIPPVDMSKFDQRAPFPQPEMKRTAQIGITRAPPKPQAVETMQHIAAGQPEQQSELPRLAASDDLSPLGPNELRARIARDGIPDVTGVPSKAGRIVRVAAITAEQAQRNGAIKILPEAAQ